MTGPAICRNRSFALLTFCLTAWSAAAQPELINSVEVFVSSFMEGRLKEAYAMLAPDEREAVTLADLERFIAATFPTADSLRPIRTNYPSFYQYAKEHLYELDISIDESRESSAEAPTRVRVRLSTIDLLTVAYEISRHYPDIDSDGISDVAANAIYETAVAELYGVREPPKNDIAFLLLVSIENGRPVFRAGLREMFDRIRAGELSNEAWMAKAAGRTEYSVGLYREASRLDPSNDRYRREFAAVEAEFDRMRRDLSREPTERGAALTLLPEVRSRITGIPVFVCDIRNDGPSDIGWFDVRVVYLDEDLLAMNVEIVRHHFGSAGLLSKRTASGIRVGVANPPFGWTGERFLFEIIDAGR